MMEALTSLSLEREENGNKTCRQANSPSFAYGNDHCIYHKRIRNHRISNRRVSYSTTVDEDLILQNP